MLSARQLRSGMHQEQDVRVLAYSVSVKGVRAVELGPSYTYEHDFGPSTSILSNCDELLGELRSPALLSLRELPALRRFASGWGRELLPEGWLSNPPGVGVVVPNGILHSLPFHLVSTGSGDPLCVASRFAKCSSLTLLLRCLARSPSPASENRVDPFVPEADVADRCLVAGVDALGHSDEDWRRMVIRLISDCGLAVDGGEQSIEYTSVREALTYALASRSYNFAMLAAHGYRDALDALGSGLLVRQNTSGFLAYKVNVLGNWADQAGTEYEFQDLPTRDVPLELKPFIPCEMLTLRDLKRAGHIVCPLVAVLGCQSGNPTLHAGDQPLSMAELMLRIGAASALAPMWDVRLSAVEAWMRGFLGAWRKDGQPRSEAARIASRTCHDNGAALHDVGCLVLHGDWR